MSSTQPKGYLAVPDSGIGNPVLILHAWWGLNDTIMAFCDRLADAGFVAFAPDLYYGTVVDTVPDAEAQASTLFEGIEQAQADVAAASRFLCERAEQPEPAEQPQHGVAVIGFSLGAYFALDLSNTEPDRIHSVVIFYGTRSGNYSKSKAAYLGHFAEQDDFEPQSEVDALEHSLKDAHRPLNFYQYPKTGHWFFEADRVDAFNPEAATLAWDRTLAFLNRSFKS